MNIKCINLLCRHQSVSSLPTHRYELIPSFKKLSCCLLGLKIKWYAAG